jgi:hypothetical protein
MAVDDAWGSVSVPILEYIARHEAEIYGRRRSELSVGELARQVGHSPRKVVLETERLIGGGYIGGHLVQAVNAEDAYIVQPRLTERAARSVGRWATVGNSPGKSSSGRMNAALSIVATVVTTVAGTVGALYLVAPSLKPKERLGAVISAIEVEQQVKWLDFKRRTTPAGHPTSFQGAQDSVFGDLVFVTVTLNGYKDKKYGVVIETIDASTNKIIGGVLPTPSPNTITFHDNVPAPPLRSICNLASPAANEDNIVFRCWSWSPPKGYKYFIRVAIFDATAIPDTAGGGKNYEPGAPLLGVKRSSELTSDVAQPAVEQPR